jgi:hypothetical protein
VERISWLAEAMKKPFHRFLSQLGNDFNAHLANAESEYLGQIDYDFQKSCVTGPWEHKDSLSDKN